MAHFLFVVILDRETKKKVKLASIPIYITCAHARKSLFLHKNANKFGHINKK